MTGSLFLLAIGFQLMASESPAIGQRSGNDSCGLAISCDACITQTACGYCYDQAASPAFNGSCLPVNPLDSGRALVGPCANFTAVSSTTWASNWCPTPYSWLIILGLVLYLLCFASGMGPMPWTINSEIYPQWGRAAGNSASTTTNWLFNLLVSMTFLTLMETITKQGPFNTSQASQLRTKCFEVRTICTRR